MRLDRAIVEAGLAPSRARARQLIEAGVVRLAGQVVTKPAAEADPAHVTLIANPIPWVSRAALKLDHALEEFGLSPEGAEALDVGASTGGFTEVLLAHGAARVHALDVGHGQLHPTLRHDPRVVNHEGVNARAIPEGLIPPVDWIVSDVSFISLEKALPGAMALAKPRARLVALVKPQFEAGPEHVGKGGLVTDPIVHDRVKRGIRSFLERAGWMVTHEAESPILGGDGNREFLIAAIRG